VLTKDRGQIALAVDRTAVNQMELIVLVQARAIRGPRRRNEIGNARTVACVEPHIAEPRASRISLAHGESRAGEQARVVGDVVPLNEAREEVVRERAIAAH
jgi:hypothetical protein